MKYKLELDQKGYQSISKSTTHAIRAYGIPNITDEPNLEEIKKN